MMSSKLSSLPAASMGLSTRSAFTRGSSLFASSSPRSLSTRCHPSNAPFASRNVIVTPATTSRMQLSSISQLFRPSSVSSLARRQNSTVSDRPRSEPPYKQRELPELPSMRGRVIGMIVFALASWTAFTLYAMNLERLSSTAFKGCLSSVKDDPRAQELVGEIVRTDQKWYLGGNPWVDGKISMMQGKVDLSFRVKGAKGAATIYFTALRRSQHDDFEVLRYFAVGDQGERVSLLD